MNFSQVDQTHEVYGLRTRVQILEQELNQTVDREQQLVAEIEQLRTQSLDNSEQQQLQSQLDALREHLTQNQGQFSTQSQNLSKSRPAAQKLY
jgi:gas vesicle protein